MLRFLYDSVISSLLEADEDCKDCFVCKAYTTDKWAWEMGETYIRENTGDCVKNARFAVCPYSGMKLKWAYKLQNAHYLIDEKEKNGGED